VLRNRAVVALVVWTLLIWTTRIRNIWGDDGLDTAGKWGRTALALSFTVLAVAVAVAAWRRAPAALRLSVLALAAWTTGVWVVRSIDITAGDHSAGFKVVHLVLAVVSVAFAGLAARSVGRVSASGTQGPSVTERRPEPASGSGSRPRP
jgi:hypothetical protein